MAHIVRCHGVIEFERSDTDQQIGKRNADSLRPALAVDSPGAQRRSNSYRKERHGASQFGEKPLAIVTALRRVRPRDAVSEFERGHHR